MGGSDLSIIQRGKTWYLKKRVPVRFRDVETRKLIWASLKTDSRCVAATKASQVWAHYIAGWEAQLSGRGDDNAAHFRSAQNLAQTMGYSLTQTATLSAAPLEEILERVEASQDQNGELVPETAAVLLGAVEQPQLMLSKFASHDEHLSAHTNRFKNTEQMRLWRNPRKRAIANLMAAIGGDLPVTELSAKHAQKHRKFWKDKCAKENVNVSTANKDFNYISGMLKRFYEDLEVEIAPAPYANVSLKDRHEKPNQKKEVPVDWIVDTWFAPGAFDTLNSEARDILLISIETGCRQREIMDLPASAFQLDDEFPHLRIQNESSDDPNERREVKNLDSDRLVPLAGVALAAAKRNPSGFPRYRGTSNYSNNVNKYMKSRGLLPEGITIGGIRHTWESRLKDAGIQTDDRGELMGHSLKAARGRETYGDRMLLKERFDVISPIILPVPDHLA
ncbi:DUF6538 domain-containing protein [uncultured Pelagimonas sp.]|uniref:DUF6538 domain-containing protein n=1 Tax=uncultured Pelagimonas sp. TaxID=1618102 RepID=UPI002625F8E2|nr:DUF6538 domain-containing protein [uncultured Pelagimonas sp.]